MSNEISVKGLLRERFAHMRKHILHLSQPQLAAILGVRQRQISDIETGRTVRPADEMCLKLIEQYGINMNWLLCGVGEVTLQEQRESFIHEFKTDTTIPIPFYNVKASAGKGISLNDYAEKDVMFFDERYLKNILGVKPENLSLITACGDSMDSGHLNKDDILDGDLLLVDNSIKEVVNNKIFVVNYDNNLLVKRVIKAFDGTVTLYSNNPKYEPIVISPFIINEIIGKVIWNGNKHYNI